MLTVSCYTLHPLAQRAARLWRRVQALTDWLAGGLACVCCPCAQLAPYDETSDDSDELPPPALKSPELERMTAGSGEPRTQMVMDIPPFREGCPAAGGRGSGKLDPIQGAMGPEEDLQPSISVRVPARAPQRLTDQAKSTPF